MMRTGFVAPRRLSVIRRSTACQEGDPAPRTYAGPWARFAPGRARANSITPVTLPDAVTRNPRDTAVARPAAGRPPTVAISEISAELRSHPAIRETAPILRTIRSADRT